MSAYLLNTDRPPAFCPGCSHERVARALDRAFQSLGLAGSQVALVSDIGCSGLFDTFFHTHALHGLHGRALTYAAGLKMARPELNLIVTMGDGGLGIGGAHLLSACRRNLDMTLLVLNNFNFGMTGGQYSATTPQSASVGSGFLNQLDRPMDLCQVAAAAGAPYVFRCSAHSRDLARTLQEAIQFEGFAGPGRIVARWRRVRSFGRPPGKSRKCAPPSPAAHCSDDRPGIARTASAARRCEAPDVRCARRGS